MIIGWTVDNYKNLSGFCAVVHDFGSNTRNDNADKKYSSALDYKNLS